MKDLVGTILERVLLSIPWPEVAAEAWNYCKKIFLGSVNGGLYEVIEQESRLDLEDPKGLHARFSKVRKIKFTQERTIAIQDHGWSNGETLIDFQISPGRAVDFRSLGYKTYVLIALDEIKNRGELETFKSHYGLRNSFLKPNGYWDTEITEKTGNLRISIVFPRDRAPQRAFVTEQNQKRSKEIQRSTFKLLQDGRVEVSWEKKSPRLFEHYILAWDW
jgi:hypothetical protein